MWLLFNTKWTIVQLYMARRSYTINEMMMITTLYSTNTLSLIFIVLTLWNNSPWVDMSLHSDTLSWFRANQTVFARPPWCCVLSGEATNTTFIVFGLTGPKLEPTIYRTRTHWPLHHRCDSVHGWTDMLFISCDIGRFVAFTF